MDISFQNAGSQLRPCAAALVCVLSQDAKNNFGLCRKSLGRGNVEFPLPRLTLVAFFISAPMPGEGVGGGQSLWSFEPLPRQIPLVKRQYRTRRKTVQLPHRARPDAQRAQTSFAISAGPGMVIALSPLNVLASIAHCQSLLVQSERDRAHPFHSARSPVGAKRVPAGDGWLHEVKFDGYRVQAHNVGSRVVIYSRNGHDFTERFP